jgi:hypothetical protein
MEGNFLVVEGFGDFTESLESCDLVKVVQYFGSEAEAIRFAANYYEEQIWGEDAEGFAMSDDMRMSFFVIVREVDTSLLMVLVKEGHSVYDGEICTVTGDVHTCPSCMLLAAKVG